MYTFLVDSIFALLGMMLGAGSGYYLFLHFFASEGTYSVFNMLAIFAGLFGAGVFGILGANARHWFGQIRGRSPH